MLQVGIHGDDSISISRVNTGFQGIIFTKVPGQINVKYMRIDSRLLLYGLNSIIPAAIVNKNKFIVIPSTADRFAQFSNKVSYVLLLIIRRNYYGQFFLHTVAVGKFKSFLVNLRNNVS